jgi:hypothetical protein
LHHTHCITPTASHSLHHTHCITLTAPHSLHHTHCITLTASHSLHHTHCITLTASHSLHHTHCTTLTASHSMHHTHSITLTVSRSAIPLLELQRLDAQLADAKARAQRDAQQDFPCKCLHTPCTCCASSYAYRCARVVLTSLEGECNEAATRLLEGEDGDKPVYKLLEKLKVMQAELAGLLELPNMREQV